VARDRIELPTRGFQSSAGAGPCVTIGRYVYLSKRLTAVLTGRFYRFEHIVSYSSGKVVGKLAIALGNGCHYVIKPWYRQYGTTRPPGRRGRRTERITKPLSFGRCSGCYDVQRQMIGANSRWLSCFKSSVTSLGHCRPSSCSLANIRMVIAAKRGARVLLKIERHCRYVCGMGCFQYRFQSRLPPDRRNVTYEFREDLPERQGL